MQEGIIVFGLGITGVSSAQALSKLGYKVYVYVDQRDEKYRASLEELKDFEVEGIEDVDNINWSEISYLLKSPGIKLDNPFILLAQDKGVEVVSDIELAYRIWRNIKFVAITGTNGKTTTTHLVSSILTAASINNKMVGNVGIGLLAEVVKWGLDYVYVLEMSSFQLATSSTFRAPVACLTNITADHIDWHKSLEEYVKAKLQITKNQTSDDLIIVNADDPSSELVKEITKAQIREVSTNKSVEKGTYCLGEDIIIDGVMSIIKKSDINLVGEHNLQNTLFAIELSKGLGVEEEFIRQGIRNLIPIEHRIEKVTNIKGVDYYNDSKGTNVDSTVKALDGFTEPIILIAGGYDKNADYSSLFENRSNIKKLILFGQTKYKIRDHASSHGLDSIICDDLTQAVNLAYSNADKGDVVLFSPACASWDMYKNFEERGQHFKNLVKGLIWKNCFEKCLISIGL